MDRKQFHRDLGALLRRLRNARGLSQETVAQAIGLTRVSVTSIEQGRQGIYVDTLIEFLGALGFRLFVVEDGKREKADS